MESVRVRGNLRQIQGRGCEREGTREVDGVGIEKKIHFFFSSAVF